MNTIATLYRLVSRAPNYIKRFGITQGLLYSCLIELYGRDKPSRLIKIKPKNEAHPIYLRSTRSDRSIFWQCIVRQQYDITEFQQYRSLQQRYKTFLEKGKIPYIIDCGANVGLSVRELSKMFPLANIIAIEPDPDNIRLLRLNTEGRAIKINIIEGAVWSKECQLQITNRNDGAASYQVNEFPDKELQITGLGASANTKSDSENQESLIKAVTVNSILQGYQIDELLVIKLDVEGAQKEIFSAETSWMEKVSLTIIELDDWLLPWQGTSRPFISAIAKIPSDYLLKGELLCVFKDWNA
jgi:FkbM family methyltransferase